jgi:hypothetical protein
MNNIFFFQTQEIHDNTNLFDQLKKQNIFFSYFLVDQKYYLVFYRETPIDINFISPSIHIIQELDSKQRQIRSLRGFFLYALETMGKGEDYEILNTNLQPFFWRKVKNIIRQNKKDALLQFLFGKVNSSGYSHSYQGSSPTLQEMEDKITNLQSQVNSLQDRIIQLEQNQGLNLKHPPRGTLQLPDATKSIQQDDYTLSLPETSTGSGKTNMGEDLTKNGTQNDEIIYSAIKETDKRDSKIISEDSRIPLKTLSETQLYNITSNQEKALNQTNFITLANLSEQEKIEIIQKGFQLQSERIISLKKYYESTDPYSLFQSKGYQIKYESIRRTKLYQQFKT